MVVLETPRLRLREFTLDDADYIIEQLNDPLWLQFIGNRNIRTADDARQYLEKIPLAMYARDGFGLWAVETVDTSTVVGMCGLIKRDGLADVDIGFALLPRYRGLGYAFEAAAATLQHGHATLGIQRIVAITAPDNHVSARLLAAIGMRYEQTIELANHGGSCLLYASTAAPPEGSLHD
jgi:RimJ/RimL family protein N-acetyltransferase